MFPLNANKDSQKVPVTMVNAGGALMTGLLNPTIEITKNGALYAAPDLGTWTEIGYGDYTVTLDVTDTNTIGWLMLRVKHASSAETKVLCTVGIDPSEMVGISTRTRRTFTGRDR